MPCAQGDKIVSAFDFDSLKLKYIRMVGRRIHHAPEELGNLASAGLASGRELP